MCATFSRPLSSVVSFSLPPLSLLPAPRVRSVFYPNNTLAMPILFAQPRDLCPLAPCSPHLLCRLFNNIIRWRTQNHLPRGAHFVSPIQAVGRNKRSAVPAQGPATIEGYAFTLNDVGQTALFARCFDRFAPLSAAGESA